MTFDNKPMVSVLVTSFNRAAYIEETIESILQQSYTDYEIVISDNCSTDNTMELLEKYRTNPKIKIHQNETNIGQFANRNKCASLASGKYLKYIDSDDLIYPWGLQLLVTMMEQFPQAGWGLCSLVQIVEKPYPFQLSPRSAYLHNYHTFAIFDKAPLSAIIKKEVFEQVNGFDVSLNMAGDFDMWQKLALSFPVVLMPDGIVWNRVHPGQEMRQFNQYLLQYEEVRIKYLRHPNNPLDKSEVKKIFKQKNNWTFKEIIVSIVKLKLKTAFENLKVWKFYIGK
jgi:glycosyltransferase involved in cell wall biosynthesis